MSVTEIRDGLGEGLLILVINRLFELVDCKIDDSFDNICQRGAPVC